MKKRLEEVVVVEGIHDKERILKYMDVDIITSGGKGFHEDFLDLCDHLNKTRGIIVFTDPDGPGEYIRRKIMERVGDCKHASLHVLQSKSKGKVGIEHASKEDIINALTEVGTYKHNQKTITWTEYVDLGLVGQTNSQEKRNLVSQIFKFPISNGKTHYKYLNMLGITKAKVEEAIHENNSEL